MPVFLADGQWRNVDYQGVVAECGPLPDLAHHITFGELFASLEAEGKIMEPALRQPEDLALLVYTSGTTSDPKGVMHSSRTQLAELAALQESRGNNVDEVTARQKTREHLEIFVTLPRNASGKVLKHHLRRGGSSGSVIPARSGDRGKSQASIPHLIESQGNIVNIASQSAPMGAAYIEPYASAIQGAVINADTGVTAE